jgi:hypothetical protein
LLTPLAAPATPAAARAQVQAEAQAEQSLRAATQTLARARRQEQGAPAVSGAAPNPRRAAAPRIAGNGSPAAAPCGDAPYQVVFRETDLNTLLRTHKGAKKALRHWGVDAAVVRIKPGLLRVGALVHLPALPGLNRPTKKPMAKTRRFTLKPKAA